MIVLQTDNGHVDVDTLAGMATLAVHQHQAGVCYLLGTALLDPGMVLALATELTHASVPPAPVVVRRVRVRKVHGRWRVTCPECFGESLLHTHPMALKSAELHLLIEHASERAA